MAPLPCEPWSLPKYRPTKEIDLLVFQEDDRKMPDVNAKRHVPEMTKKPSRVHKDPQEPVAQIRLSNRQEAESRKIPHGIKTRGEKSHSRRFTGASRLFVDLQPKAALQPSDRGRHTKQVSQTRIPFSAPLRPNRNNSSALDKKPHEDRTSLKSHNKPISRNPSFAAPGPPQPPAPSRARMNQAAGNSSHDDPHDHHRRNEQYKTAKKAEIRNWAQLERPDSFDHSKFHSHDFSRKGAVQSKRSVLGYRDERDRVEFSGPLLSKSQKVDELLEKRDQHIRKAVRKSWLQRATGSKQV